MRIGVYSRFSTTRQRDTSITDQLRNCRAYAEQRGWTIVKEYSDFAQSGTSLEREAMQALIKDIEQSRFDVVLADALDRFSRDQENMAGLHKLCDFHDVALHTVAEGEIDLMQIGFKGTVNAFYVKDLSKKTRSGQQGSIERGRFAGGNAYGYDLAPRIDYQGQPELGHRTINVDESAIIIRIFRAYANGESAKMIAVALNRDGIVAPRGGAWSCSTINGNRKRGNGILNNELYIGRLVWGRQRFIKRPNSKRRQARANAKHIASAVPALRIVPQELWDAVKARQKTLVAPAPVEDGSAEGHFRDSRRPRYLLSGLTQCAACGGGYSMISKAHLGCSTARNKGTCSNLKNIRRDALETRVMDALRHHLMQPALFKEFCNAFTAETNRLRRDASASQSTLESTIRKLDRDLDRLVQAVIDGGPADRLNAKMRELEARKTDLEQQLQTAKAPPPILHPEMASFYRRQIERLHQTLLDGNNACRQEASEIIRSLIEAIVLIPSEDGLQVEVRGDLAGILAIASGTQKSATPGLGSRSVSGEQFELVAGAGFEPAAFRL